VTNLVRGSSSVFRIEAHLSFKIKYCHNVFDIVEFKQRSVDQIAKKLKGTSARKLLMEFPGIKKRFFWDSGLWSPVIYGDSLGREPDQIRDYIRNQGKESSAHDISLARFFNRNTTGL